MFLNWKAFAPEKWKRGTLKIFVERAYENNNYPKYVIKQVLR